MTFRSSARLLMLICLAGFYVGCGVSGKDASPVGTKSGEAVCHRSPERSVSPTPTMKNEPNGDGPEVFTGAITSEAKPLSEIYADMQARFNPGLDEVLKNGGWYGEHDDEYSALIDEANRYLRDELYGKRIENLEGWIVATGQSAIEDANGTKYQDYMTNEDSQAITVSLVDPFDPAVTRYEPKPSLLIKWPPDFVVAQSIAEDTKELCIGQKVGISADVTWIPALRFIALERGTVRVVDETVAGHKQYSDYEDVWISISTGGAFMGTSYSLMIYGDGLIVFGGEYSDTERAKITVINEDQMRELLAEFDRADFANIEDVPYDQNSTTDAAYITTTLRHDGNAHIVRRYGGNHNPPEKLLNLEKRIYEITGAVDWLGDLKEWVGK